jgi:hypothetical protein
MNPEFWNIFPVSSREFSGRIPVGIVPSPVGYIKFSKATWTDNPLILKFKLQSTKQSLQEISTLDFLSSL